MHRKQLTGASGLKPGQKTLDAIGGAHKLQSWPHNILTGMPSNTSYVKDLSANFAQTAAGKPNRLTASFVQSPY